MTTKNTSTRGWVYILSNRSMPGLVKVGYSIKDPTLRIQELGGTGLPYPFVLEYDALVIEPRTVEQAVHKLLAAEHEAKEFFRTTPQAAAAAIRAYCKSASLVIIAEQRSRDFGKIVSTGVGRQTNVGGCQICGTPAQISDHRCPKCFAFLT